MKKGLLRCILVLTCTIIIGTQIPIHPSDAAPSAPETSAQAATLVDVHSGRILYSKTGQAPMKIASLTKIMTAIIAIEQGTLSDMVTIPQQVVGREGSSVYLKANEQMSLENLLYGLMLRSGNDAAEAIAIHIGGSLEGFVWLMNEKAAWLGMEHTHFANPHGLDAPEHYSSTDDMAKLAAHALRNEHFQKIVQTEVHKVVREGEQYPHVWFNKNKMLRMYPGADGVKTGYTRSAGRCLVSSATAGEQQLVVVTLNDQQDWADHRQLLDYGFHNYPLRTLLKQGEQVSEGLLASRDFAYPLNEQEVEQVSRDIREDKSTAKSKQSRQQGQLRFHLQGQEIAVIPLYKDQTTKETLSLYAHNASWTTRYLYQLQRVWKKLFE